MWKMVYNTITSHLLSDLMYRKQCGDVCGCKKIAKAAAEGSGCRTKVLAHRYVSNCGAFRLYGVFPCQRGDQLTAPGHLNAPALRFKPILEVIIAWLAMAEGGEHLAGLLLSAPRSDGATITPALCLLQSFCCCGMSRGSCSDASVKTWVSLAWLGGWPQLLPGVSTSHAFCCCSLCCRVGPW